MKKRVAFAIAIAMLMSFAAAYAAPLNTREQMAEVFNNGIKEAPVPGADMLCLYLEDLNTFAFGVESQTMMDAAANAGTGKNGSAWETIKATVYQLYTTYRNLADTFGHTDVGLHIMLRASNNGESFTYYMVGNDAGVECTVYDPITNDDEPVVK